MKCIRFFCAAVLAIIAINAHSLIAAPVFVANPSFEDPVLADNSNTGFIPGWDVGNAYNPSNSMYSGTNGTGTPPGADGSQVGFMSGGLGYLYQYLRGPDDTLDTGDDPLITANTQYTMKVAIGARLDFPYGGYSIQLDAYNENTNSLTVLAISTNVVTPSPGQFVDATATADTTSVPSLVGQHLVIFIGNTQVAETDFDNVRLTAVPEPSTLALLTLGAVGLLAVRRSQG
jgi:hypothetical protein